MAEKPDPEVKKPPAKAPVVSGTPSRRRRILVWTLVVLASVIAVLSILTTWVNRQMLDTNAWNKASAQVIRDPKVQQALSVYVVNQLYEKGNVSARLEAQLPPNLKALAGPISAALRQPAAQGVQFLLTRPRIQQLWINANTVAHEKLVNVLENKTGAGISTGNGVVTVDLRALVVELGAELGLPASALAKLPPNTGVITILRSDQLSLAQQGVQAIRVLSTWLLVLVLAMYALAVYLGRGIRRQTLRNVGWGLILVGLLVLVAQRYLGNYIVNGLTPPTYRPVFHNIWLIGTSILGQIGWATIVYGIIIVLGAVLAGSTRAAIAVRTWAAPVLNQRQGIAWLVYGFVFILLVLWGPTHALRTWWGILLLGGLLALGLEVLRRQTLREFPNAGLGPNEGGSMGDRWRAVVGGRGSRTTEASTAASTGSRRSTADEIAHLNDLRTAGAITDDEFARAKALALSS
jgi:hypothetical protein